MPAQATRYSPLAQTFHWVIAGLIILQFTLARRARHKSVGMTILMLAVLRLLWRLGHPAPPLPAGMTRFERIAARGTHVAFYVLLFAMPLTGWTMSSAKNYSVSWFGLFTWPNLIAKNEAAFDFLRTTHDTLSNVLFAV